MASLPKSIRDRDGQDEFQVIVKDLEIEHGASTIVDCVALALVHHEAREQGGNGTPPSGGGAWILSFSVIGVTLEWDEDSRFHTSGLALKHAEIHLMLDGWKEGQDEWATRVWNERAEGDREAAMESRADGQREGGP